MSEGADSSQIEMFHAPGATLARHANRFPVTPSIVKALRDRDNSARSNPPAGPRVQPNPVVGV